MSKVLPTVVMLCLLPVQSYSHPGKTDTYGGHKCLKGCEEWGLYYEEYHLHDKEGKPIHISRKKAAPEALESAMVQSAATETLSPIPVSFQTQTVTLNRYVMNIYEENLFLSNPFIYILLILLLLLLVLRMNRKREER